MPPYLNFARAGIDGQHFAEAQRPPGIPRLLRQRIDAAKDRFDAGNQLSHAEGFRQIVIGTHLEPEYLVHLRSPCGKHEHWGIHTPGPQAATDFQAVNARQHDIEQDEIELFRFRDLQPRIPCEGQLHGAGEILQVALENLGEFLLVFNDQYITAHGGAVRRA